MISLTVGRTDRRRLARRAALLAWFTIAWNTIEGIVAVGAGIAAGSIALVGFGLDSGVEVFAGAVVVWQLRGLSEEKEQRALRLIAVSFFALAAYTITEATRDLLDGDHAATSLVGVVLATVSLLVMPALAVAKRRTADSSGTRWSSPTPPKPRSAPISRRSCWAAWSSTPPSAGGGPTPSPPWASLHSPSAKAVKPGAARTAARRADQTRRSTRRGVRSGCLR